MPKVWFQVGQENPDLYLARAAFNIENMCVCVGWGGSTFRIGTFKCSTNKIKGVHICVVFIRPKTV